MITPILITLINEHTVEVLTDFRTILKSARHAEGNYITILKEPKDSPGLIGAIWTLEAQDMILGDTITLCVNRAGENSEYIVEL